MTEVMNRKKPSNGEAETDIFKLPKDVQIRLLEERDCSFLLSLIYDNIFYENGKLIAMDTMKSKRLMCFVAASSFLVYFHLESMILANIWFFSSVALVYLFLLYFVCRRNSFKGEDTTSAEVFYDFWSDNDEGRFMWVALQDGRLVGAAGVQNVSETSAVVCRVVVLPSVQRQGIAMQLMLTVLDNCVNRNLNELETSINYRQIAAQKLFKKLGFRTSLRGFYQFGVPPFFRVRAAKYTLSLEKETD